ncbi:MAG: hypothetical protein KDI11_04560 [Alphaproteobacteria bacterium]|nr:hypothetical protein [Alphaproteobacteria bacterium]
MSEETGAKDGKETKLSEDSARADSSDRDGKEQEKSEPKDSKKTQDVQGENVADFQGKVEIQCKVPLSEYNSGPNKAYRAYSNDSNKTPLIAIVCERYLVPRRTAANVYSTILDNSLVKLVAHGVVYWPPAKRELYVFIYYDNLGKPLLQHGERSALGWRQDDVMSLIVKPYASILQDFRDKDFVHGAIRPDNMFCGGAQGKPSKIILGDCLSVPQSLAQPVLYEPIVRGMADPIARGKATPTVDLYALGVSIAVIMRHNDPLKGLSDDEIVRRKILHGSYSAITGKDRFKGEILELLRGLLHDEPSQRWTIDEVLEWLDGRRLSPKQSTAIKKAPRPFDLGGDKYFITPLMAMDIENKVKAVKSSIEDDSLLNWIERSLEDEEISERFQKAVVDSRQQSTGSGYESCLAGNVSIALDPDAPIRFRNLRLIGDGIGNAIVEAVVLKQPIGAFVEVFRNSLVLNWLSVQNPHIIDVNGLFGKFEKCRRYLKTSKVGDGVERVIYLLNPECPCLSEVIKDYYIVGADDLLNAYEDLCKKGQVPATFLDRHSVAFLYEKEQKVIEPYLYDLNTHESHKIIGVNLKCLAAIQKRYSLGNFPAIAKVMAPRLQAVVKRYHDRHVQERMREAVAEFQSTGDLKKIASIFENAEVVKKDFSSFRKAMLEFKTLETERLRLEMRMENKVSFGIETGREVAAILSCILAFIIIAGTAFVFLSDNTLF